MTKVLVYLAARNGEPFIEPQLASIWANARRSSIDVRLAVSLEPSSDRTLALLTEEIEAGRPMDVLAQLPASGGAARNFFRIIADADLADADFVAFADQDDIWNDDKVERAIATLKKTNASGYSSNVTAFWSDGRELLIDKAQPQKEWDFLFEAPGPGCTFVLTRELALALQAFVRANRDSLNAVLFYDWLIYAFARSRGFVWTIDSWPSMRYRQHESNDIGANAGFQAARRRASKLLEGFLITQGRAIALSLGIDGEPFVQKTLFANRQGLLVLAVNASKCRRRLSHQIYFAVSCLLLAVFGRELDAIE